MAVYLGGIECELPLGTYHSFSMAVIFACIPFIIEQALLLTLNSNSVVYIYNIGQMEC